MTPARSEWPCTQSHGGRARGNDASSMISLRDASHEISHSIAWTDDELWSCQNALHPRDIPRSIVKSSRAIQLFILLRIYCFDNYVADHPRSIFLLHPAAAPGTPRF